MATSREDPDPVPVTDARARLAELVGRAEHGGRRTVLTRHGRPAAALVGVADLERLRALDDDAARRSDADEVRRREAGAARDVVLRATVAVEPDAVWLTLVEPARLRRWWPEAVLVDAVGVPVGGVEPAEAEVAEVVEGERLVLRWVDPGATALRLTHRGIADDALAAAHRAAWEQRLAAWRAVLGG